MCRIIWVLGFGGEGYSVVVFIVEAGGFKGNSARKFLEYAGFTVCSRHYKSCNRLLEGVVY